MAPRKASASNAALPPFPFSTTQSSPSSQAKDTSTMSPPTTGKDKKASAKSKIVVLNLPPKSLAKFPHEQPSTRPVKAEKETSSSTTPSAPTPSKDSPVEDKEKKVTVASTPASETPAADATPNGADSNAASTPAATNGMLAPPANNAAKRKGVPGPKPGMKRTASQLDASGVPKPRGKPGPKKKARTDENGAPLPAQTTAAPKLGPKANQGAINACLRALDRTGAPCRKWSKKPFAVRSFTGYSWGSGTYAAAIRNNGNAGFPGDVKSDTSSTGEVSGSKDVSGSGMVSGVVSEVGTPAEGAGMVSSPAPVTAATG